MSAIDESQSRHLGNVRDHDQLLTMDQAASLMGVSVRMIRRLTSERRLAYVKVGRHVRIPVRAIESFISAGYVPPLRSPEPRLRRKQAFRLPPEGPVAS